MRRRSLPARSAPERVLSAANHAVLVLLAALCLFPILHVVATSLSSSAAAAAGRVGLLPVQATLRSYQFVMASDAFPRSFAISLERVLLGVPVNVLLSVLTAFPLSRSRTQFRGRTAFVWYFLITSLFSGGLIPWYMVIRMTGLVDSIWALILPGALPIFNVILLVNFFRTLPQELDDAARIDGAGHASVLFRIVLPVSLPVLAAITLFSMVGHWNAWFDGLLLMNSPAKYPLQSYLQTVIISRDPRLLTEKDLDLLKVISERTTRAAQTVIAMVPILCIYPVLQRYFTAGLTLGAVKE